jgi:hypothetical protein
MREQVLYGVGCAGQGPPRWYSYGHGGVVSWTCRQRIRANSCGIRVGTEDVFWQRLVQALNQKISGSETGIVKEMQGQNDE